MRCGAVGAVSSPNRAEKKKSRPGPPDKTDKTPRGARLVSGPPSDSAVLGPPCSRPRPAAGWCDAGRLARGLELDGVDDARPACPPPAAGDGGRAGCPLAALLDGDLGDDRLAVLRLDGE